MRQRPDRASDGPATSAGGDFDLTRYVWVTSRARPGFVEFNFSIGDPALYLEMILPESAFEEFCAAQQAVFLDRRRAGAVARDGERWRYGTAGRAGR